MHFRELRAAITGETIETKDQNALLSILVLGKAQAHGRYRKRSRLSEERRASARIEAALDVDVLAALQRKASRLFRNSSEAEPAYAANPFPPKRPGISEYE